MIKGFAKKALLLIFSLLLGFVSISALAVKIFDDSQDDICKLVAEAINKGDAKELANYFNSTIDLTVPNSEGTFSKAQAEVILKNFFLKNPPKSFTLNHQGNSKDGSIHAIGVYVSTKDSFRTYFLLKKTDNTYLIHQLQFELQ